MKNTVSVTSDDTSRNSKIQLDALSDVCISDFSTNKKRVKKFRKSD